LHENIHGAVGTHVPGSDYAAIVGKCDAHHHVNRWPIICPCGTGRLAQRKSCIWRGTSGPLR